MQLPSLHIYEVGPRDGLQNQPTMVSTADKQRLITALVEAGLTEIEVTSFVSPKAIPQLADAPELMGAITPLPNLRANALIINQKGYDRALEAGCRAIAIVVVVSESLSQKNSRMSVSEGLASAVRLLRQGRQDGVSRRVYLAPAWICPYEGPVDPARVIACADTLWAEQPEVMTLADTIGQAHPLQVGQLCETFVQRYEVSRLAAHFHDTAAFGLANAYAALQAGIRRLDSSIGGLGGCPFAPGAAGNLATEDLVLMAHRMGLQTGISLERLWEEIYRLEQCLGRPLGGRTRAFWESQQQRRVQTRESIS